MQWIGVQQPTVLSTVFCPGSTGRQMAEGLAAKHVISASMHKPVRFS
jgi:hypothetical protein